VYMIAIIAFVAFACLHNSNTQSGQYDWALIVS
jgi:hypothetical protein